MRLCTLIKITAEISFTIKISAVILINPGNCLESANCPGVASIAVMISVLTPEVTCAFLKILCFSYPFALTSFHLPNNDVEKPEASIVKSDSTSFNGIPDCSIKCFKILVSSCSL